MPDMQCGAVPARGADYANHLARSVLDYAYLTNRCVSMLFLDLEKAFDHAVREYLWGFSQAFGHPLNERLLLPSHVMNLDHNQHLR